MTPLLGPLADNGGPTETHALLAGSPAIDAGLEVCTDPEGLAALTTDQRGVARPMDGDGEGTAACDIGAYEVEAQVEETTPSLDHYLSYEVRPSNLKHYFRSWRRDYKNHKVTLDDQFAKERKFLVLKPVALLNPASEDDGAIGATQLVGYSIFGHWRHRPRTKNIQVDDQFGTVSVDLVRADRLLVSASTGEDPVEAPDLANLDVDKLLCYRVKQSNYRDRFPGAQVSVMDSFNQETRTFEVKKPIRLCTSANGEGIEDSDQDLMCYSVRLADDEPRHDRIKGLWVNDQFGPKQVDTRKEQELCVPSTTTVSDVKDEGEHAGDRHFGRDDDDDDDGDRNKNRNKNKDKDDDDDDD